MVHAPHKARFQTAAVEMGWAQATRRGHSRERKASKTTWRYWNIAHARGRLDMYASLLLPLSSATDAQQDTPAR
jgi:hypothetical protein